ncbi:MAG: translation initiation factor IF-2 [Candidatus Micrarchaeaceae archaeon]
MIRQPIICVMGHVDHGKTTLLDKIKNSTIAAKEAGGITQHIGASEVPVEVIKKLCGSILNKMNVNLIIPGLLFIDTPGHEAFTNLRKRGSSVADLAILVVDVTKGFEPQTIEAIDILKEYKTPFVVAANKVDLITGWIQSNSNSIDEAMQKQTKQVSARLDSMLYDLIGKLGELGFSSELYTRINDFKKEIAIIPISAKTGEGIAELLVLVSGLVQRYLSESLKIEVNGPGKGSILEKKEVKGLGMTIDAIIYDGSLHINDTIAFASPDSIKLAKIKALLKPKPLEDTRDSVSKYFSVNEVNAACGVKISANNLEDALAGSPIIQVTDKDYEKEIKGEIGSIFEVEKEGVVLKTDSIGSLEAISRLLNSAGFSISKKGLGNVSKSDVLDAFTMYASNPSQAVVLAFNVMIDQEAFELASSIGIKIIQSNIIYSLIDEYTAWHDEIGKNTMERLEMRLVFPGLLEVLPNACFHVSHPAIFGVRVLQGRIKPGYLLINISGAVVGKIKEIQNDKQVMEIAREGDEVAISMDEPTFGRQIKEGDTLYTRVKDDDEKLFSNQFSNVLNTSEKDLLEKIKEIKKNAKAYT